MQTQQKSTGVKAPDSICQVTDASSNRTELYDSVVSLTPIVRDALDSRNEKATQLKCRKYMEILTMKVRIIRTKSKQQELPAQVTKQRIEVIGLVDHKICHEEGLECHHLDHHTLMTTPAWRNSSTSPVGRVSMMVKVLLEMFGNVISL